MPHSLLIGGFSSSPFYGSVRAKETRNCRLASTSLQFFSVSCRGVRQFKVSVVPFFSPHACLFRLSKFTALLSHCSNEAPTEVSPPSQPSVIIYKLTLLVDAAQLCAMDNRRGGLALMDHGVYHHSLALVM